MPDASTTDVEDRLSYARVLVELGELFDAEAEVAEALDARPDDLDGFSLLAKIKHMRGELSQAVACWAQVHARSPLNEMALMHLRALLHLAQDPETGAGEFLALGRLQLVRKPAAHLEIEAAFRLLLARRPDEARLRCQALAQKYRGKDRELYKLAVLADAFIAELGGDVSAARRALEGLGQERGFEADTDRVMALARLYERLGGKDELEAAVHICQYVERRFERISILGRLAALYRRLGHRDLAAEYETKHLAAFRRRMHRPTFGEVVRVAARRYIPLFRLRRVRWMPGDALPPEPSARERALGEALQGSFAAAAGAFAEGGSNLDRKYLADVADLSGDAEEAARLYMQCLRDDPDDLRVLGWLLGHVARTGSVAVAGFLREPLVGERARDALEGAIRLAPLQAGLWRELGTVLSLEPGGEREAARCRERAQALEEASRRDQGPIGRVLAAGVYHFVGKAKGLIHEVWVHRDLARGQGGGLPPERILGNLTPEMRQGVQNTFYSVREYARTKFPHRTADILDWNYTYKVTKEDEPSGGLSAGLPSALAFLSVFLQQPVPQDLASSGVVVTDAHDVLTLRAVGDTEHKVKAAYNRNLRAIVLPLANQRELELNIQVPPAIQQEVVRWAPDLDAAVRLVFGEDVFVSRDA